MLELKENNNSNKDGNSLKGFGLPRVVLTSLTTLTIDEDTKKSDYVGVVVYNTGSSLTEGIYSWDGNKWVATGAGQGEPSWYS